MSWVEVATILDLLGRDPDAALIAAAEHAEQDADLGHDDVCTYGPGICECSRGDAVRIVVPTVRAYLAGSRA